MRQPPREEERHDPVGGQPGGGPAKRGDPMNKLVRRRHISDVRTLAAFRFPVGPAGLVIGRVSDGTPVILRFFGSEPTRIAAVGGWWLGRLLVFRALALGARVVVRTPRADQWQGLSEWATNRPDRLAVVAGDTPLALPPANASQPVLQVWDGGMPPAATPSVSPWHTHLSLIHQLTQPVPRDLAESDLRIVQCLTGPEAAVMQAQLRLSTQTAGLLQALRPDMVAVLGAGPEKYLWLTPTPGEVQRLGAPRRAG